MKLENFIVYMIALADKNGPGNGDSQVGRNDREGPDTRHALLDREVREAAGSSSRIGEIRGVEVGHGVHSEIPDEGLEEVKVGFGGAEGSGDGPVAGIVGIDGTVPPQLIKEKKLVPGDAWHVRVWDAPFKGCEKIANMPKGSVVHGMEMRASGQRADGNAAGESGVTIG